MILKSKNIVAGSIPKYRQLLIILRNAILAGELAPGDRLPSEGELSDSYGVSRGTVRKAIGQLEAERLVNTEHGIGSFVRSVHPNAVPFYFTDSGPPPGTANGALTFEVVAQEAMPASMEIAERLSLSLGATVIYVARRQIVANQVVSYAERYLREDLLPSLLSKDLTTVPFLHKLLVDRSEYPLLRAEIEIEAHALTPEEAKLLSAEVGESAIAISRMTYTAPNKPAVWYRALFKNAYYLGVEMGNEHSCNDQGPTTTGTRQIRLAAGKEPLYRRRCTQAATGS